MKRVALHTLGCKLNFAETSTIGRQFVERGYEVVDIDQPAEVCVINTCSVTERADRECRQIVRRALRHSPQAFVIVVGCYAQLQPKEIASIPGVDLVLGTKEKFELFRYAESFQKVGTAKALVAPVNELNDFNAASSAGFCERTRAFLKIQDGCDYGCAFCTIPLARGASRSVAIVEALAQAKSIAEAGYKEIVLTGVSVGDYGRKINSSLVELLRQLVALEGLERLRISSIELNLLDDELLEFWLSNPKLCKHFHIPLQGGSDELLKAMRRRYLTSSYADRVDAIKAACPGAAIGADLIVGFPGETDPLFEETYRFLVDLPISYLHVFTYSERPNTVAVRMPNHVEPRIRFERSEMLRILSAKKRRAFYESFAGTAVDVLFEAEKERGWMTGLSSEYVRVHVPTTDNLVNQIKRVRIQHIESEGCIGELIDTSLNQDFNLQPQHREESVCV